MTTDVRARCRNTVLTAALAVSALAGAAAPASAGVQAGVAVVDGTYNVGSSAGQYASTRVDDSGFHGYGDVDPHVQQIKNMASYGVQSREKVKALVIKGADGKLMAIVTDDHYVPQDALWRRTAQLLSADTNGAINETNLVMSVSHNHSSPSYSSFDWGVWTFQDVFDFRFYDYYAKQNAKAVEAALKDLHPVRVSATVSYFDKFQRNPMGPGIADDGTPTSFPKPYTDHDLSVVHVEKIGGGALATLVNIGQHPEFLEGYDLISGEYTEAMSRLVERTVGGVTLFTQNATGTSEVERETYHSVHERELFDHAQYAQMEWGARQLADAVIKDVTDIRAQKPNGDKQRHFGMTSYHDRFVPWMSDFPVALENRWFPGPISHPYPGVSSCRTDPAFQLKPRIPLVGLPDCEDLTGLPLIGDSFQPIYDALPDQFPGLSTDDLEALGIPVPENYSAPSFTGLEDTLGVHMQAFRLGPILFTVCSCEQWVDQAYNIKTRTDTLPGNEWLGYDWTKGSTDLPESVQAASKCTKAGDGTYDDFGRNGTGTWTCPQSGATKIPDELMQHMRAQIYNDASRWDDPTCGELGCGIQGESEPVDLKKIFGNYTHDDTTVRGGKDQTADYAKQRGYKMTVTISMANDYNGYIATYRDFSSHDHYRKALTGWGPHSSDYYATRLSRMGHALNGDTTAASALDEETDVTKASLGYLPGAAKEVADQTHEEVKVRAVGEVASAGVAAYGLTIPADGGSDTAFVQPKDIERFDAATFTWDGGNNYTDNPDVVVQRKVGDNWVTFADQSGEVPVTLKYPSSDVTGLVTYRLGGQVWKWTASFEAFVSRFPLVDPQGTEYEATPPGTYRFLAKGARSTGGGASKPYTFTSKPFEVKPWSGITVENAGLDGSGHVVFDAGPTHTFDETHVRRSESKNFGDDHPLHVTIGPVDFPDKAKDPAATGARFLTAPASKRGYSSAGTAAPEDLEHYC
ncbi:MAG: hypothetical protein QOI98_1127, partial [Solirubrobacteraceae bacterium]|nr:hypothetical protein [Solirubrobacteraceae bacterium]